VKLGGRVEHVIFLYAILFARLISFVMEVMQQMLNVLATTGGLGSFVKHQFVFLFVL
jgi:hypothetical protein